MEKLYHDEQVLLSRIASGDRKAFNQLYSAYIEHVYNYIYLFTKSKEETEEILQQVFINIWENRGKLEAVSSFKNYVFRSAKNKLINHVRHKKIKRRVLFEISQNAVNTGGTTDYEITYKEYYQIVQEAVEMLPPKRKLIFKMNIEEGISYDEIAEQLMTSKSVVKKQFYKARDFVRQYLYKKGKILSILLILLALSVFELF